MRKQTQGERMESHRQTDGNILTDRSTLHPQQIKVSLSSLAVEMGGKKSS